MSHGIHLARGRYRFAPARVGRGVAGAVLSGFIVVISLVSSVVAQAPARDVSGVVVQYTDGTAQRFDPRATPPPTSAPTTMPTEVGTPAKPKSKLGVNVEQLRDYSRSMMFIDAMKTARKFGSAAKPWTGTVPLDENGWPTTDAGAVVMTEALDAGGVYALSFTGRADVKTVASSAVVRNVRYDAQANRTTADVVFTSPPLKPSQLFLSFANTSGGVRDVKLLRPGYSDDSAVFTREFLRALEPFGTIRFMDFLSTNNSKIARWDDRPRTSDATFTERGGPYEYAIALGNLTGKDIWLHVPIGADDEFLDKLAQLVKAELKPGVNCYIEYSNEIWNGTFTQCKANFALAKAEVAAGENTLNDGGTETNQWYWAWRRVGKRTLEIEAAFKRAMGDDPRIRMILAGQLVNPRVVQEGLTYIERYAGPPREHLYGIAAAPYFGHDKAIVARDDLTVDDVCNLLLSKVSSGNGKWVRALHELSGKYGVKSVAYEGGVDLGQSPVAVEIKRQAQYDPRTGEAVEKYLRNWFESGGDIFCYFNHAGRYQKYGYWGLTDDVRKLDAPKFQAAARVAESVKAETP